MIETQWFSIDSAPYNTSVMVCGSKRLPGPSVAFKRRTEYGDEWIVETCSEDVTIYTPKYWMPLPTLPPGV